MTFSHPLLWLALLTFLVVIAIAVWSLVSTRRRQQFGPRVHGMGNAADPVMGAETDLGTSYMQQSDLEPRPGEAAPRRRSARS